MKRHVYYSNDFNAPMLQITLGRLHFAIGWQLEYLADCTYGRGKFICSLCVLPVDGE